MNRQVVPNGLALPCLALLAACVVFAVYQAPLDIRVYHHNFHLIGYGNLPVLIILTIDQQGFTYNPASGYQLIHYSTTAANKIIFRRLTDFSHINSVEFDSSTACQGFGDGNFQCRRRTQARPLGNVTADYQITARKLDTAQSAYPLGRVHYKHCRYTVHRYPTLLHELL